MRHEAAEYALARARTQLMIKGAGVPGRVLTRRAPAPLPDQDVRALGLTLATFATDANRRARLCAHAAAAMHGSELAMAITSEARAALPQEIDAEARAFALRHRNALGRDAGQPLGDFALSLKAVEAGFAGRLPASVAARLGLEKTGATALAERCLDLALASDAPQSEVEP